MSTNYFLNQKPCEHCGRSDDRIHIGKSSGGWVFAWRGYHPGEEVPPLSSPSQWEDYLKAQLANGGAIVDEYGTRWGLEQLLDLVRAKREGGRQDTQWATQVEGDDFVFQEFS